MFGARASAFGEPVQVVPLFLVNLLLEREDDSNLQLLPIALKVTPLVVWNVSIDMRQLPIGGDAEDINAVLVPANGIRLVKMNTAQSLPLLPATIVTLLLYQFSIYCPVGYQVTHLLVDGGVHTLRQLLIRKPLHELLNLP